MDKSLYLAMNGATQAMKAMQVNNNNLANLNTPGFRGDLIHFISQPVEGPGHQGRIYSAAASSGISHEKGALMPTGRNLDVAVKHEGWMVVQTEGGRESYIRTASLQVSPEGLLVTGEGKPILGNSGPISIPPANDISIGSDGTISFVPAGQGSENLAVVDRLKLVNPKKENLYKDLDGAIYSENGTEETDASIQVASGFIEGSNVNSVEALVKMIEITHHLESNVKLISKLDENSNKANDILHMPS